MGGIADDTAFADGLTASLELRLHQHDEPGAGSSEAKRRRERLGQADEAQIGDDGPDRLADQRPNRALSRRSPPGRPRGRRPELRMELTVPTSTA